MLLKRHVIVLAIVAAIMTPIPAGASEKGVSQDVKVSARKLAKAWIETASAQTLDQLANRSIAFAGMVAGWEVTLDGRRFDAGQALVDSGLTIIKSNVNEADAAAMRNTVYILMEVASGRAKRQSGGGG